jgi:hypothetical protein
LAAVWLTARVTMRRERRTDQRRAAVEHRITLLQGFKIDPTGPYHSFTPEDRDLELALMDLGFTRFEATDLTRRLWDHRQNETVNFLDLSRKEMTVYALKQSEWRALEHGLGSYISGEISLRRARRRISGVLRTARRERRARRWAEKPVRSVAP